MIIIFAAIMKLFNAAKRMNKNDLETIGKIISLRNSFKEEFFFANNYNNSNNVCRTFSNPVFKSTTGKAGQQRNISSFILTSQCYIQQLKMFSSDFSVNILKQTRTLTRCMMDC